MNLEHLLDQSLDWIVTTGARILIIIVIAVIALKLASLLSKKIFAHYLIDDRLEGETQKRAKTLNSLVRYVLSVVILTVTTVTILGELGIKIGPILAAAGIVGLAVGFGAQQLVQDIISGFFILLEDQIRVGDVVQIGGKGGLVERVTLRMTILRDLSGNVHFVRNGHIDVVTNMTKDFSYYVFDIGVAYRENVEEVMQVIKQVDDEIQNDPKLKNDILEPMEILGLDQFADSAVIIKARIKTKPISQWNVGRAFNLKLKKKFDENNIEIPFPHVTVYMGEDKNGEASPLHVMMAGTKADKAG
jgi:moderate conductance mechanosensitive channel